MLNPQVHRLSRPEPATPGASQVAPGVTADVVDAPEIGADDHVLVVSKASGTARSDR
ncbi:hypothetical protein [Mycolicibacter engbaekii]|uniref:hypothetical protein n=1 Tax=Mycolicibacter engbaekii TaxID=188915 RepID=UPI0013FDB1A9|nr:hypothetical protein [Mycolicibacter engbaekii]